MEHRLTSNYHTHTWRCNHASGTEREYVEAALAQNMKTLGFADHGPYVFPEESGYYSGFRIKLNQVEDYVSTVNNLKKEYKDKINIQLGYELEYYPKFFDKTIDLITGYGYEYLILGQHFQDNEIEGRYAMNEGHTEADLIRYTDQIIEAISTGLFMYVAHPDVYRFDGDEKVYEREAARLCEAAKKYNVPLEINLLGLGTKRIYPSRRFFKVAGEVGAKVVVGIDAHSANAITKAAETQKEAFKMVDELNLKLAFS